MITDMQLMSWLCVYFNFKSYTTIAYAIVALVETPIMLCRLFILGKFILVLYKEIRKSGTCDKGLLLDKVSSSMTGNCAEKLACIQTYFPKFWITITISALFKTWIAHFPSMLLLVSWVKIQSTYMHVHGDEDSGAVVLMFLGGQLHHFPDKQIFCDITNSVARKCSFDWLLRWFPPNLFAAFLSSRQFADGTNKTKHTSRKHRKVRKGEVGAETGFS